MPRLKTHLFLALLAFAGAACGAPPSAMDLLEFRVLGNTVLPRPAIERAVYPHLGPGKSVAEVEKARSDLETAYHEAGYLTVYVTVPEQKVEHGIVLLQVTEGVIERTRVTGAKFTLPSRIRAEAPSTAEGSVPYFPALQSELAAVSRAPGVHVTPSLESGRMPGTTDLDLKVSDTPPLSAWLDYNNAHSANTGATRVAGGVSYSNLFQRAQTLSLQYQTSPDNPAEASAVSASYAMPLQGYQRTVSLYAVHSNSNVTSSAVNFGDQALFGNNDIIGARYLLPLRPRPGLTQQLSLGLDFKDSRQVASSVSTPLRYWTLDGNYGLTLEDGGGNWQLGVVPELGLRGPGTGDVSFNQRRASADSSFAVLKLDAQRLQRLPLNWSLAASADLQYTKQPLINNEQMSAGGVGSVRGYLQSEATGDEGLHASLELRAPSWAAGSWFTSLQPYAFMDAATLRVRDPLPGETANYTLASYGLGLNLRASHGFSLALSVADPLRDGPDTDLTTSPPRPYTRAHQVRVHFDTRLDF